MNIIEKMLAAFKRRINATELKNNRAPVYRKKLKNGRRIKRRGNPIRKVKSRLDIKRTAGADHMRARLYKRTFRGVCGAHSWKDLDRIFKAEAAQKAASKKPGMLKRLANAITKPSTVPQEG